MKSIRSIIAIAILSMLTTTLATAQEPASIKFGVLPVMQALPMFVAVEQGIFAKHGLDVELVLFNTAAEKSIAMAAKAIDGEFADLITPLVAEANGQDIVVVATGYASANDRPMFALLGKPGGGYSTPQDLAGKDIAISSNSVIDYVTEKMMAGGGVERDGYGDLEMKNIGLRLQMLIAGQCEAATLPEPLVSLAMLKGATLIADDTGIAASLTTLVFSAKFARDNKDLVVGFLNAIEEANSFIYEKPEEARAVLISQTRVPKPLQENIALPVFSVALLTPERSLVEELAKWLLAKGAIDKLPKFEDVVSMDYLPALNEYQ